MMNRAQAQFQDNTQYPPNLLMGASDANALDLDHVQTREYEPKATPKTEDQIAETRQVAEVIIPHIGDSHAVILPIIASLSQHSSDQWITWVTDRIPSKALLEAMGANLKGLRIVHADQAQDARWIAWQALAQGNSHTVIAERAYWSESDLNSMEEVAQESNTRGIMVALRH